MEKLKEYINQIRGVSYKPIDSSNEPKGGYIPLLRANNINNGKINFDNIIYVKEEKVKSIQYLKKGDILICTSSGSKELVGKAGLIKENYNATFGAFCKVIRVKEGCDYNYFNYFFQSNYYKKMIQKSSNGANINNLKTENFDNLNVNVFEIHLQTKIANKLDKVQEIIDIREKQIEQLDDLIKSQFVEMFGDEKKYPKEELKNNIVEMFIGPFGSALKNEFFVSEENKSCVVYEQKHAINKFIGDFRYVDKEKHDELKRFEVLPDDIIVSCRGTIGETYVIPEDAPLGIMHPSIMKIRLKKDKYNPIFFNEVIKQYLNDSLNQTNGGTIKMGIKASDLEKTKFIRPEIKEQLKFLNFKNQIDKQKFEIQKTLEETQKLQESLMYKYFG